MRQQIKEHPILFNGAMVRAVLSGSKTQTRREVKHKFGGEYECNPWAIAGKNGRELWVDITALQLYCPFGKVGDQLWVRETFGFKVRSVGGTPHESFAYRATDSDGVYAYEASGKHSLIKWTPSIHMPRKASRIQLEITGIRVERLNDCSDSDAIAEGVERTACNDGWRRYSDEQSELAGMPPCANPVESYQSLWESINGIGSWATNPWVWVVEFKVVNR